MVDMRCEIVRLARLIYEHGLSNTAGGNISARAAGRIYMSPRFMGSRYQFERVGYFYAEPEDSTSEKRVFNRIVGLRDSWATEVKKG